MKHFFLLLLLPICLPAFSQAPTIEEIKALLPTTLDSVRMQVEKNRTKEMLLPPVEEEVSEVLGSVPLSAREITSLLKRLGKKSSYQEGRALLTHHSLVFTCYKEGVSWLEVQVSTLTRNINIFRADGNGVFAKISKKMGRYLIKLLIKYGFYNELEEIGDLEGVI